MSKTKELNFFVESMNWSRGVEWYAEQFTNGVKVIGEASPLYSWYPRVRDVPLKMHRLLPQAKFLYVVRDPIERLLSQYAEVVDELRETRSFEQVMKDIEREQSRHGYVQCSCYFMQLEQYLRYFEPSQIHVLALEDLLARPRETMRSIFRFLGVSETVGGDQLIAHNSGERKRRPHQLVQSLMPRGVRRELIRPRILPWKLVLLSKSLIRHTGTPIGRPALSQHDETVLNELFLSDVRKLREFTRTSFQRWRAYGA